jgi:hypothetical protein
VRTAFHDAVARFGGVRPVSSERFLLVEDGDSTPPLTPLSRSEPRTRLNINSHVLEEPRPIHHARRESYVTTPARDAFVLFPARALDCSSSRRRL